MQAVPIIKKAAGKLIEYVRTLGNPGNDKEKELREAQEKIREKNERLREFRRRLDEKDLELSELRKALDDKETKSEDTELGNIEPKNIVWLLGAGRTGSTWLAAMMGDTRRHEVWSEPQLGELFDRERLKVGDPKSGHGSFVFSPQHEEALLHSVKNFVLQGARSRFSKDTEVLVIKEPHGSAGAPLLVQALPESRVILLVRDPRDTVASALDAFQRGMWRDGWKGMYSDSGETADDFVEGASLSYLRHMGGAKNAYDSHGGPKISIRYEDLISDPSGALKRICNALVIDVDEEELVRVAGRYSWENIPEEKKGRGKFYRKGKPGSWEEDLTPEQANLIEEITTPILKEFYPA